jgi:hypothetical protein
MRTKKIGDQSPLRVPAVPAKKLQRGPFRFLLWNTTPREMLC